MDSTENCDERTNNNNNNNKGGETHRGKAGFSLAQCKANGARGISAQDSSSFQKLRAVPSVQLLTNR